MLTLDSIENMLQQKKKVTLTVETSDEGSEIFILNSKYERIEAQCGRKFEFKLSPGVYIVKVRTGSDSIEKSVVLHKNETVQFAPIQFTSPAPLDATSKTHENHIGNAVSQSLQVHVKKGVGSQIYVFVRDWSAANPMEADTLNRTPAKGLTLRDSMGHEVVNLEKESVFKVKGDPWAACNIQLKPGPYKLSLKTAMGDILEQTIMACPGFQTQVFLLQRDYAMNRKDLRADLMGAAIFMARLKEGFSPVNSNDSRSQPDFRLSELARQALVNDRQRLSGHLVKEAINRKFANPMMAIYGAHLLLRDKDHDRLLIKKVVNKLRRILSIPHPDVEALAIKAGVGSSHIFTMPPMLRLSWSYVLDASVKRRGIVPANSPACNDTRNLWTEGVWLVWGRSARQGSDDSAIFEQIQKLAQLEATAVQNNPQYKTMLAPGIVSAAGSPEVFDMPQLGATAKGGFPKKNTISYKSSPPKPKKPGNDHMMWMVQSLGIPCGKLEDMLRQALLPQAPAALGKTKPVKKAAAKKAITSNAGKKKTMTAAKKKTAVKAKRKTVAAKRKTVAKKPAVKKAVPRKTVARKTVTRKTAAKKPVKKSTK